VIGGIIGLGIGAAIASDRPRQVYAPVYAPPPPVAYAPAYAPAYAYAPPPPVYVVERSWAWRDGYYWDHHGRRYFRDGRPYDDYGRRGYYDGPRRGW
jgi:hypothetical protein